MFSAATDRLPPQSVDAEEAILGGILLDPNAIERVKDILQPEAFYFNSHRNIYRAALALHEDNKPTDLSGVTNYLTDKHWLEGCGGTEKMVQLVDRTVSAVNIDYLAGLVNEKYRRRQMIDAALELINIGYDSFTSESAVIAEAKIRLERIISLSTGVTTPKEKLIKQIKAIEELRNPIDQYFAWEQLCKETGKSEKNLKKLAMDIANNKPLVFYSVKEFAQRQIVETDWLVPGLLGVGTTSLLVAESKTGKSLLHYDWAYHVAAGLPWGEFPASEPQNVLIVQTDEPEVDCQTRIKHRGLDELDNITILTNFSAGQIGVLENEIEKRNIKFVIIDSLLSINTGSSVSANDAEYSYFMYGLKNIASRLGCHILLISHTNKSPQKGLDKIAGTYGIPASVSDIFLLERRQSDDPNGLERILSRVGSRTDGNSRWKLELNLDDYSFSYLGLCDQNGDIDQEAEKQVQARRDCKALILGFLNANSPTGYEAVEIAHHIGFNEATTRKCLGELARGCAPLICSKRSQREGSRAKVYFCPSDRPTDRLDPSDQLGDQLPNPVPDSDTAPTDRPIAEKEEKSFSQNSVTVTAETNIACDSSPLKSEKTFFPFSRDQLDQLPSNPVPVSDTATDRLTDRLNPSDQLSEPPPYPSIGDWIWCHPVKGLLGMVCYISRLVKNEAWGQVYIQGNVHTLPISRWVWDSGQAEPYNPKKHPPIPPALEDYVRTFEKQILAAKNDQASRQESGDGSEKPLAPKFKEGDRVVWAEKFEFGTIRRYEQFPEKCSVHLDKQGLALIEEFKLELVTKNPDWEVGDRCRYKDQVGTVVFPHLNSPRVVWDEPDRSGVAIRSLAGLETTTEEGGELLPAPKAVANYLSLKCGDTVRIGKHPQHKPKWSQKAGQKVRVLSINLGLSANQLFAIAEIPGEEFPVKLFLSAVDIVEGASE
jgi:replicative DNA helicase